MMTEQIYLNYLERAMSYYVTDEQNMKYFNRIPKSRNEVPSSSFYRPRSMCCWGV